MTPNRVKLVHAVTFMIYLASVVSLILLPKSLIWNKITFQLSNSLNLAELVANKRTKSISKKIIYFSIRFIATFCLPHFFFFSSPLFWNNGEFGAKNILQNFTQLIQFSYFSLENDIFLVCSFSE